MSTPINGTGKGPVDVLQQRAQHVLDGLAAEHKVVCSVAFLCGLNPLLGVLFFPHHQQAFGQQVCVGWRMQCAGGQGIDFNAVKYQGITERAVAAATALADLNGVVAHEARAKGGADGG